MSLLDDVSIVVTPNGYKAGELYAVVPVPTEGAELVTSWANNDFSSFASSGSNITQMVSSGSGNNNYSLATITSGKLYKLEFTSSQAITCQIRTSTNINLTGATVVLSSLVLGLNEIYFTTSSDYTYIGFYAPNSFTDTQISGFTLKEETKADMDVTRATAATRVDEAGLVNYAEIVGSEKVTNGEFATDLSGWSNKSSTSSWVSGSARIDNSTGNANSGIFQDIGLILGKTYTLTATLKLISADSNGNFVVLTSNSGGGSQTIIYTGDALVIGGASVTETIEFTTADSDVSIQLACNATNAIFEIDNISVKEVTRDNVPRIDYTGGGCPHILAEPQRTNLITYSETFSDSSWTKLGAGTGSTAVVTSDYAISPDGTQNATRLVCDLNGGGGSVSNQSLIYDLYSSSGDQSLSIYVKSNTGSNQTIYFANTQTSGDTIIATNEWQRFTFSHSTTNYVFAVGLRGRTGGAIDDTADILIWGGQAESGSFPTSYIPTSGSTVTRNQDQFTRDGIGSLINSTEGVLFAEIAAFADNGTFRVLAISDGTNNNTLKLGYRSDSNAIYVEIKSASAGQVFLIYTTTDITDFHKVAVKYKVNDFALWINGVEVLTDTSGNTPIGLNRIALDRGDGFSNFYGKVKQLQVYKTALTDEQLIQLTGTSGTDFYESYAEMASALTYTIQ